MKTPVGKLLLILACCSGWDLQAAENTVTLNKVTTKGVGDAIGTVSIQETPYGLVFSPKLSHLTPGIHGFHLHTKGDCAPAEVGGKVIAAGAAGGHWNPKDAHDHEAPWGEGHLGGLPALTVDKKGEAELPVLAPRIKTLGELQGLSLVVHEGGDNYSDQPKPLGGGGGRVACGVIR